MAKGLSKEFKVGLMGIISLAIFYFGFNYLKGIDFFSNTSTYYALYKNIDGLSPSNPVIINGLTVGRVGKIKILQNKNDRILVELNVNSDIQVRKGSTAKLFNLDFLGSKAIELILSDSTTEVYESGDTLLSEVDQGITAFLEQSAGHMADNLGATIGRINDILDSFKGNSEKINHSLSNIEGITKELNKSLPALITELKSTLNSYKRNSDEISGFMADIKPTTDHLASFSDSLANLQLGTMINELTLTLNKLNVVLDSVNQGQGTIGKLISDDSLYIYLSNTARDLDLLLVDLEARPERYVQFSMFGKKDKSEKKKNKKGN